MSFELLEKHDNFAQTRNQISALAEAAGHWAGIPMPLDGEELVVEPRYPNAKEFLEIANRWQKPPDPSELSDWKIRSSFWSAWKRSTVVICENQTTKQIRAFLEPGIHHVSYDLRTMGNSVVWGIEQEYIALQTLGSMLRHHLFKYYLLTGMFLERSERSGVTYIFRRLKPTVAIKENGEQMRILAALCMHPIGYYKGSWAGAMCPTDDVIAHLQLMRGDEAMYWRRCNQHPPHRPEAGL